MFVDIREILKSKDVCGTIWAHTAEGKENETLEEHTRRTEKYFLRLLEDRNLKVVMDNFVNAFFKDSSEDVKKTFEKIIMNIVTFHDLGKINPYYQKYVKNKNFICDNVECLNGKRHSLLSAVIYFDYFVAQILSTNMDIKEKGKLQYFVFLNSYIISRHHGDLTPVKAFKQKFSSGMEACAILEAMNEQKFEKLYSGPFLGMKDFEKIISVGSKALYQKEEEDYRKKSIFIFAYVRFFYSLLVASDYYATTEYKNNLEIRDYGSINEIDTINQIYERTDRVKNIRNSAGAVNDDGKKINILRNSMFMEAEKNLLENMDSDIYFLEAPTGGGKSNMGVNTSLKLLNDKIRKIIYVYPFNTLIEQNINSLKEIFGKTGVMDKITVINSINPIKKDINRWNELKEDEDEEQFYQMVLLDRQFLNYPFILTTHVNLFDIMFGHSKEATISFYQLAGSVIVLDEIQSYKNDIWTEIMYFLQSYAKILNIKIVIMSATLPALDYLTGIRDGVVSLISDRKKYFEDKRFKDRVTLSFELLGKKITMEELKNHLLNNAGVDKNIFIEFIKKASVYEFFDLLKEHNDKGLKIYCLTGDYNQIDRDRVLKKLSSSKGNILVATQVIEAGVDIDMDMGYKDISKLDSEEQFLGRINRNYKSQTGRAYFFDMDNEKKIYRNDFRIDSDLSVANVEMQNILLNKDFQQYYGVVLQRIKDRCNDRLDEKGIEEFFNIICNLDFKSVEDRIKLIEDEQWHVSVFISRNIETTEGVFLDGKKIWQEYKELLQDNEMPYAKKQVRLADVKSRLSYFIYKVKSDADFCYNDRIGDLYYIEDGEKYIEDGHLNEEKITGANNSIID